MLQASLKNNIINGITDETILIPGNIDLTGVSPIPEVGWEYDPITGTFSVGPTTVYLRIQVNKRKLLNNGTDSVSVTVTLLDTKAVLIPVNRRIRLVLREDNGLLYDLWWIDLVSGTYSFSYSTTQKAAIVHVDEKDNYKEQIGLDWYVLKPLIDESDTLEIGREV